MPRKHDLVITTIQGFLQTTYCLLCLLQYNCSLDVLTAYPFLVYIKLLYFCNPDCENRINVGNIISVLPDAAFVTISEVPFTVTRTFVISWVNFVISLTWFFASLYVLATSKYSYPARWPWVLCTVILCCMDFLSGFMFAYDIFFSMTLDDLVEYIGGNLSGSGNIRIETASAACIMTIIHMRVVIFFALNVSFVVYVLIGDTPRYRDGESALETIEPPTQASQFDLFHIPEDDVVTGGKVRTLPRVIRNSRRRRHNILTNENRPDTKQGSNTRQQDNITGTTIRQPAGSDNRRSVKFPKNLLSLPQRLEDIIAAQETRLDRSVVDSACKQSANRGSQSLPLEPIHLDVDVTDLDLPSTSRGRRRSTVAELQSQLPWAYVEGSANRMRDQLPPDEDLPPVPLPDYAAMPSYRKSSVHRASGLSAAKRKRYNRHQQKITQSDVLY